MNYKAFTNDSLTMMYEGGARIQTSVSVLWRGGEVDTIFGFEKEDDALR
jgi:hypothetical protein